MFLLRDSGNNPGLESLELITEIESNPLVNWWGSCSSITRGAVSVQSSLHKMWQEKLKAKKPVLTLI